MISALTSGFPNRLILGTLESLDVSQNHLSSIPNEFNTSCGGISGLKLLNFSRNKLEGSLPTFTGFGKLESLDFSHNKLNGKVELQLSGLNSLKSLNLSYNHFIANNSGAVPQSLSNIKTLTLFAANQNGFIGSIPIGLTKNLRNLDLSFNDLNGTIPQDLLSPLNLQFVDLTSNNLEGTVPGNISVNLIRLRLGQNALNGLFPSASFGSLHSLTYLELDNNQLSGPIPSELGKCKKLALLNLAQNKLSGPIPVELGDISDLQGNKLRGRIPLDISNLNVLLELQLGGNQVGGPIPEMPLSLQIALNLSHNLFEGPIPISLSRLTSLEVLDLSYNRFSGQIPDFLTKMVGLTRLVLSNNQLSGVLPEFGSFVSVETREDYRINDEHFHSGEEIPQSPVIQGKVLTANNIHKSNIDFAKAMVAVSEPSNVVFKTRFSTYYKDVMPSGTTYFVKKLNWSEKIFQLGSHELFGEELKNIGKLNNSNVMIPLGYLLAADSAHLLYEFAPIGTLYDVLRGSLGYSLDWASRYSKAIGVAQGLAFLHGCDTSPILLLDLSSKSILLKSQNEAQIGDIELYKVIDPSKSTGSFSVVAGSVGYIPPGNRVSQVGVEQHNKWDHILDSSVSKTTLNVKSQMLAVLKVALACLSVPPECRPKMKSVLRMLLNAR
ncbi:hypothetical protein RND71_028180 [Anisodus tanguticus]|uniref:Protein kinase domain-containing protein n=1 Tax=Anisodus tanguticus TaxID=243964 RepID=A0AAE1RKM2_9SOLA|nr:hypothetical protein RND71_028180 [Anisodus tanguticus]